MKAASSIIGRRGRVIFPDIADPTPEAQEAKTTFRFHATLRHGGSMVVDLADLGRPELLGPFAHALWRICQIGGPAGSVSTAKAYVAATRRFWTYLDDRHPALCRLEQMAPQHLDDFAGWLSERHTEVVSYQTIAKIVGCLRFVHQDCPATLSVLMLSRLHYVGSPYNPSKPRDAYDDHVNAALREAARRDVHAAHNRIVTVGNAVRRDGPIEGGEELRSAYRMTMSRLELDGTISFSKPIYKYLYWLRQEEGLSTGNLVDELHGHLYLNLQDIIAFLVMLSLTTGIEIECCKELGVDCLKNAAGGHVDIEYIKRRARGAEWKRLRVRDGGSGTPGGLIRLAMKLGTEARRRLDTNSLWAYFNDGRLVAGIGHPSAESLARFVARHEIADAEGQPINLVLARLRKTQKSHWYRQTRGQMESFAVNHSKEIAANHYADIPALRSLHETTVADGLKEALDSALAPKLLMPEDEMRMRASPEAAGLPLPAAEIAELLNGSQDLWLASCSGFYASPFGRAGEACPVPFWGCLECKSAVITASKLPAIVAFDTFMVEQRASLSASDWQAKFGQAHARITDQVLPAFPEAVVAEARTLAQNRAGLIHLPPELGAT
ncbi:MAG TPA: hypothetical protein VGO06_07735 [Bosea sp. (in: a-proteobacteria)]|uniref:hypothetical protein n=1 Tax=Bosea sp. (in: a-proteobacteria) TaxID=1871050 RepID=UPI002E10154A|nr:hypothetical protein [Bosea sp. (in: a-proteobacteria)]